MSLLYADREKKVVEFEKQKKINLLIFAFITPVLFGRLIWPIAVLWVILSALAAYFTKKPDWFLAFLVGFYLVGVIICWLMLLNQNKKIKFRRC